MFIQIVTGVYTYKTKSGQEFLSHAIYALDEKGEVFKYVPARGEWFEINKCNIKLFNYDEKN